MTGSEFTEGANIALGKTNGPYVIVRVSFFGVNYADVCVRWGLYESAKKFVGRPALRRI